MTKFKRFMQLAFISLIAAVLLAACGDKKEDNAGDSKKGQNSLEAIKEKDKIVFGVKYDTKLFGLKNPENGELEGFDIDIAKEITKKILGDESKIEFKEVTSKTRIPMVQNGQIDAIIATMTITEDRKKEVDFSDVYFEAGQALLVKKGSPIKSISDINDDTKVLAVKGSTSTQNIRKEAPNAKVSEFETYAEAFTALKAGQGDTLTTDNSILYGMADEDPNYQVVGKPFTDEPYGIAVKKGNKELLDQINATITELKDSGKYDEIYKKWIKQDVTQ
ncbi:MAG: transporter substrate-binding domain-containing protein [Bacillus sp. (in: firmicutes)]